MNEQSQVQIFSVIMDETSDVSRTEQVSIVVRNCPNDIECQRFFRVLQG